MQRDGFGLTFFFLDMWDTRRATERACDQEVALSPSKCKGCSCFCFLRRAVLHLPYWVPGSANLFGRLMCCGPLVQMTCSCDSLFPRAQCEMRTPPWLHMCPLLRAFAKRKGPYYMALNHIVFLVSPMMPEHFEHNPFRSLTVSSSFNQLLTAKQWFQDCCCCCCCCGMCALDMDADVPPRRLMGLFADMCSAQHPCSVQRGVRVLRTETGYRALGACNSKCSPHTLRYAAVWNPQEQTFACRRTCGYVTRPQCGHAHVCGLSGPLGLGSFFVFFS